MKKVKQILALISVIFLLSLYVLTIVGAITASPYSNGLFMASVYSTIVVPILLYAYILIYRVLKKNSEDTKKEEKQ